jgi:inner membrane protein
MERHPESWSTLFIIDPLYTLPLLIGTLMAILLSHESKKIRYIWASLALSTLYLGWSMVAKSLVASELERAWERAGIDPIATMSTPSPLNTILWRAVALTQEGYAEMYYSLLASNGALPKIKLYKQDNSLLDEYTHLESVRKLRWFTQDFLKVQKDENGHLIISDLRMGSEPHYVFTFDLGKVGLDSALNPSAPIGPERPHTETQRNTMHPAENPVPTRVRNLPRNLDLGGLLKRIWTH